MSGARSNRNKAEEEAHDEAKATTQQRTNTNRRKAEPSNKAELRCWCWRVDLVLVRANILGHVHTAMLVAGSIMHSAFQC